MRNLVLIMLAAALATGCQEEYAEFAPENFHQVFMVHSSPTFQGYMYEGSDDTFHYFKGRWKYGRDRYFKIKVESLDVAEPFERGESELALRVMGQPAPGEEPFATGEDGFAIYRRR